MWNGSVLNYRIAAAKARSCRLITSRDRKGSLPAPIRSRLTVHVATEKGIMMQVHGHTFLVSGGSSGLGAACARMLANAGANVAIADINRQGESLAGELGARARFVSVDVTDETSVQKAVHAA